MLFPYPDITLGIRVIGNVPDDKKIWTAYASSTDNTTGDSWVSTASRNLYKIDPDY